MNPITDKRLNRRDAIKWMLAATASLTLLNRRALADLEPTWTGPAGDYWDPNMLKTYNPGDLWPLTLNPAQRRATVALCDMIIPADSTSPSASAVGVPDFLDEWISAPFEWVTPMRVDLNPKGLLRHEEDKKTLLDGLAWIDAESQKRFQLNFADLVFSQKEQICDDICYLPEAKPEFQDPAKFFKRFRDLTAGGFYTTPDGTRDVGYIGNVPMPSFEGPPPEVLKLLGLSPES